MISEMARDLMSDNPALSGPVIAMLLFCLVFVVAVVWVVRAKSEHVDRMARLPLEGEDESVPAEVDHG